MVGLARYRSADHLVETFNKLDLKPFGQEPLAGQDSLEELLQLQDRNRFAHKRDFTLSELPVMMLVFAVIGLGLGSRTSRQRTQASSGLRHPITGL